MKRVIIYLTIVLIFVAFVPFSGAEGEKVSVYVMHKGSGQVLVSENAAEKRDVAGLTHLPALLVLSEAVESGKYSLSGDITVSRAAKSVKGPTAFLDVGEVIAKEELYKAAVMTGAGDALYALCENMAGSADKFTEMLNERLSQLDASVEYKNITGEGVPLSCEDIAKVAVCLSDCECYLQRSSVYMDKIVHTGGRETELVNQNRLIRNMQGCRGLYTGSSKTGGYSGAFYAERGGCGYICVILGEKNSAARFERVQSETEACFNTYHEKRLVEKGEVVLSDYPADGNLTGRCDVIAADDCRLLTVQGEELDCVINVPERLQAPIKAGDCVGNVLYTTKDGERSVCIELTVKDDVKKAGFFDFFAETARIFLGK